MQCWNHSLYHWTVGRLDVQGQLDSAMEDAREKMHILEEVEKNAVRSALIEERGRYCLFIGCIKPLVVNAAN